jgi:hypothetical protein
LIPIPVPTLEREQLTSPHEQVQRTASRWVRDRALLLTSGTALVVSIAATWYSYAHNYIMLYSDSHAHLQIARRVFDSSSPGLAQLGGVWLPLPHLIILPFVWNIFLWSTGLAGSIPSMICYIVGAVFVFLSARRLTHNDIASYIGALVFIFNPNVLYLQTTPLSEPVLMATMSMACYYFLAWAQDNTMRQLTLASFSAFLATMARYDGWFLFMAMLCGIIVIGIIKKQPRQAIFSNVVIFGSLGGIGIALWFLWCAVIFGDPLYFQHGPFSSQQQQISVTKGGTDIALHSLSGSFGTYVVTSMENLGPALFILGVMAVIAFMIRRKITAESLAALIFLAPFVFYVVALYTGQAVIFVPHAVSSTAPNPWFNVRYGSEIVAPAAVFIATLFSGIAIGQLAVIGTLIIQTIATLHGGVITLQDGQFGLSCYNPPLTILRYFAQHYDGGLILNDPYTSLVDTSVDGIPFHQLVTEGSGNLWVRALNNPQQVVEWIIIRPPRPDDPSSTGDLVYQDINYTAFDANYQLVVQDQHGYLFLYRLKNLAPLPNRPLPPALATDAFALCGTYKKTGAVNTDRLAILDPSIPSEIQIGSPLAGKESEERASPSLPIP